MLNFHIRKIELKNGETRYRTILTKSGKGIKTKTFRRKQDARTWGTRSVLEFQGCEAIGVIPCIISFDRLAKEYMSWWKGKDHDRARLVKWWRDQFNQMLLPEVITSGKAGGLKMRTAQSGLIYVPPKGGGALK